MPRWAHLLLEARTARSWKVPHTVLRGRRDDGAWSDVDRMLAMALTAYEDSVCPGCGQPLSTAHGDDNVGRFEVVEDICHGCEALEANRESNKDNHYPGQKFHLHDSQSEALTP